MTARTLRILRWPLVFTLCLAAVFAVHGSDIHLRAFNEEDALWFDRSPASLWSHPWSVFVTDNRLFYRPTYELWLGFLQGVFGRHWAVFHTGGLALLAVDMALAIALALRLWKSWPAAIGAAVAILLHPGTRMATSWVSANSALIAVAFYVGAILYWLEWRDGSRRAGVGAIVCALLALASKEDAFSLVLVLPAIDIALAGRLKLPPRPVVIRWTALACVLAVNLVASGRAAVYVDMLARHHGVTASHHDADPPSVQGIAGGAAYAVPRVAWGDHPATEAAHHVLRFISRTTLGLLPVFPLDAIVPIVVLALLAAIWPSVRRNRLLGWGVVAFLLACLPVPLGVPKTADGLWYQFPPAVILCVTFAGFMVAWLREAVKGSAWSPGRFLACLTVAVAAQAAIPLRLDLFTQTILATAVILAAGVLYRLRLVPGPLALSFVAVTGLYLSLAYAGTALTVQTAVGMLVCGALAVRIGCWPAVLIAQYAAGPFGAIVLLVGYASLTRRAGRRLRSPLPSKAADAHPQPQPVGLSR